MTYFLADDFLAGALLATVVFLAAAGSALVVFVLPGTLVVWAARAAWDFLRAALFLCMTPFLAALSSSLCTLSSVFGAFFASVLRTVANAFKAVLRLRLVLLLRTVALRATFTRFLADLMMGMGLSLS